MLKSSSSRIILHEINRCRLPFVWGVNSPVLNSKRLLSYNNLKKHANKIILFSSCLYSSYFM